MQPSIKPRVRFVAFTAPFGFAQGRLELVPFQNSLKLTYSPPKTAEGRFFRRDTGNSEQKNWGGWAPLAEISLPIGAKRADTCV
jgi:hypothetical protein